jgi:hypothetical protein
MSESSDRVLAVRSLIERLEAVGTSTRLFRRAVIHMDHEVDILLIVAARNINEARRALKLVEARQR